MENHLVIVDLAPIRPKISEYIRGLDEYEPDLDVLVDQAVGYVDDDTLLQKGLDAFSEVIRWEAQQISAADPTEVDKLVAIGMVIGQYLHDEFQANHLYGANHTLGNLQLLKRYGRDGNTLVFGPCPDEHY